MSEAIVRYVFAVLACIFAVLATILVCAWAQDDNTTTQIGFLGVPKWSSNVFAWHPVLTVAGFLMGQVRCLLYVSDINTNILHDAWSRAL